jgi:hypothetical protein
MSFTTRRTRSLKSKAARVVSVLKESTPRGEVVTLCFRRPERLRELIELLTTSHLSQSLERCSLAEEYNATMLAELHSKLCSKTESALEREPGTKSSTP